MDSDSDIEVLEEVEKVPLTFTSAGNRMTMESDEDDNDSEMTDAVEDPDELLDLDGDNDVVPFSRWSGSENSKKREKIMNPSTSSSSSSSLTNAVTRPTYDNNQNSSESTDSGKPAAGTSKDDYLDFDNLEYKSLAELCAERKQGKQTQKSPSPGKSQMSFQESVKAYKAKEKAKKKAVEQLPNEISKKASPKIKLGPSKSNNSSQASSVSSTEAFVNPKYTSSKSNKMMIVLQISEKILTDPLAAQLIDKEIQFQVVENPVVPDSILFEHNVHYKVVEKDLQVQERVTKEMDENIAIIFPIEQYLHLFENEVIECSDEVSSPGETLISWTKKIQCKHKNKKLTLLIQGLESYLRKTQRAKQKEYKNRLMQDNHADNGQKKKRKANTKQTSIQLSRTEIQSALISLQLSTKINYKFYENVGDLCHILCQYAKGIADALIKKGKENANAGGDFDWYAVSDSVGGIPVQDDGKGLRSLWIDQLCQFPKVGQERALAIVRKYGTPNELYKAYRKCPSSEEATNLLSDIQITVGVGPLAKKQRLGPEASRRIYRFFTATNGSREIQ